MSLLLVPVRVVGTADSRRVDIVRAASSAAGLSGTLRHSPNIDAAISTAMDETEVIVFLDVAAAEFKAALAACNQRGLPRWAVVPDSIWEAQPSGFEAKEWELPMVTSSIRAALSALVLRRENVRLRGDLCTVGRRITHDLRTSLNLVSTANEALAEMAIGDESARNLHRSASAAVEEAGSLLERVGTVLLASARVPHSASVDMEETVWNARQRLDDQLRVAGATIIAPEKWPEVQGCSALLELVWVHLLDNSVKHGGAKPRIELGWKRFANETRFWLSNSGPGIPIAKRRFVFFPVDRLHELNAPRGYGLSLVHRVVELHGGAVGYDPEPPPGGTFWFTLP